MKDDFLPRRDGDLVTFETNYNTKLPLHGAALELDAAEISQSIAVVDGHLNAYRTLRTKKNEAKSATEENISQKRLAKNELRRMAKKIKACKKYSPTIGDDLGIIGSEIPEKVLSSMKPTLSAVYNGNDLIMKFRKMRTGGVNIYCRRAKETEFTFLKLVSSSPYLDTRIKLDASVPEARDYYAKFVDGDKEIGMPSDILKVIIS